jgi:dTMP kinase
VTEFPLLSEDDLALEYNFKKVIESGNKYPGKMICLEGIEGVGKTTQLNWIADFVKSHGKQVVITREPGGTPIGEKIRDDLLKHNLTDEKLSYDVEMMLVFAARLQHLEQKIIPALQQGNWVICSKCCNLAAKTSIISTS